MAMTASMHLQDRIPKVYVHDHTLPLPGHWVKIDDGVDWIHIHLSMDAMKAIRDAIHTAILDREHPSSDDVTPCQSEDDKDAQNQLNASRQ